MNKQNMRVLILGARAPVSLEWARAFQSVGAYVCVADSLSVPLARFSRSINHFFKLPCAATDTRAWLHTLIQIIREQSIDMLLPTCEEVFYVSHCLPQLSLHCRVPVMGFEYMQRLHHKGQFAELTQDFEVRAPETHLLQSKSDLGRFVANSQNWVFKPAYSRFAVKTLIRPAHTDLHQVEPSETCPWVAQRYVKGQEFCTYSILINGKVTAHACYQPRYRVGQGAGIYLEPVTIPTIEDFVRAFGRATQYTGQVGFDFIQDASGQCHVLECNPRATSGLHLLTHNPVQLTQALLVASDDVAVFSSNVPQMIGLAMVLFVAPKKLFSKQFWQNFQRAQDIMIRPMDWRPFLNQPLSLMELCWVALKNRCGLLDASTLDIAWNGQEIQKMPEMWEVT